MPNISSNAYMAISKLSVHWLHSTTRFGKKGSNYQASEIHNKTRVYCFEVNFPILYCTQIF